MGFGAPPAYPQCSEGLCPQEFMLSYCANSGCRKRLTSFRDGKMFQFEIVSVSVSGYENQDERDRLDEIPRRHTAHFWLCGRCAASMTLSIEPEQGLRLLSMD